MTEITLAPGLTLAAYDLEGINAFLTSDEAARGAGVVVALSGRLEPGKTDVKILAGMPVGGVISEQLNGTVIRAAVLKMTSYFDVRHARYFAAGIMKAVANARKLDAMNERTIDALETDDVPAGDIPLVKTALVELARNIDDVLSFPLIGIKDAAAHRAAAE